MPHNSACTKLTTTHTRGMHSHINALNRKKFEASFWELSKKYGVAPVDLSLIYPVEWFVKTAGTASDICIKEMISVARHASSKTFGILAPEYTGPLVNILKDLGGITQLPYNKFAYSANAYRYNKPGFNRLREFKQLGWEFFGEQADEVDLILGAQEFLHGAGWSSAGLHINTIGTKQDQANYNDLLGEYLAGKELPEEINQKLEHSPLRLLDIDDIDLDLPEYIVSEEAQNEFATILNRLSQLGVKYQLSKKLVRGLDYYEHTVFEFRIPGTTQALLAGGRYDNITSDWQKMTKAMGWAAGLERILSNTDLDLESQNWFIDLTDGEGLGKCNQLRCANVPLNYHKSDAPLSHQLQKAIKNNVLWVVIHGAQEVESQTISWKNLQEKTRGNCDLEQFAEMFHMKH